MSLTRFPAHGITGLFTKERITFRKAFRIAIRFVIGFVIRTTCVHKHCNRRAFRTCARVNQVPKELCVHTSSESGFLGRSRSKMPFFAFQKPDLWELSVHKGLSLALRHYAMHREARYRHYAMRATIYHTFNQMFIAAIIWFFSDVRKSVSIMKCSKFQTRQ